MSRVIREVIAEIKAKTDQFDAQLARVEGELQKTKRGAEGFGTAIGTTGQRSAEAARQIASATETIARSGKVTGEAGKQIVAQASNIAFAFGPQGAAVGALAIFSIAVATAMGNARKEVEETERRMLDAMNRLAEMDSNALAREYQRSFRGPRFAEPFDRLARREEFSDPQRRREALLARGTNTLEQDLATLRRARRELEAFNVASASGAGKEAGGGVGVAGALRENAEQIQAVTEALAAARTQQAAMRALISENEAAQLETLRNAKQIAEDERASDEERAAAKKVVAEAERDMAKAVEEHQRAIAAFSRSFDALVRRETGSAGDLIAAEFNTLIREAQDAGRDGTAVDQLIELRDRAVQAATAIAGADALLQDLDLAAATGVEPTVATFEALTSQVGDLRAALAQLTPGTERYKAVLAEIEKIEARRSKLMEGVAEAGGGRGPTQADVRSAADYARELQQAADGALQLAQNLGGASAESVGLLRAIGQIAGNLPALSAAIAGGSAVDIVSSSVAILGALSSLVGDSPADQQRREELRANTEALERLTETVGMLGLDVTGTEARSAASGLQRFLAGAAEFLLDSGGNARRAAERAGLSLSDLDRIAAEHGITLNESIASFRQLELALRDTIGKLGEFGTDLESARREADAAARVFGITDPQELLGLTTRTLAGRSPVLDRALAGLDLSTAEGRAAARQALQEIFQTIMAGGDRLTADDMGGLDGDQLLQAILDLIDGLNAVDESLGTNVSTVSKPDRIVTADATQITADQASRLLGVTTTMAGDVRRIREAIDALQAPLTLPALWDGAGGSPGHGAVTIQITQEFHGPATPSAVAQATREAMAEAVDLMLGRRLLMQRRHTGKAVTA